jgi:hypothetical protein
MMAAAPSEEGSMEGGERVAIRAGRLLDVTAGEVQRDRVVLVRGELIEAVRDAAEPCHRARACSTCPATRSCRG